MHITPVTPTPLATASPQLTPANVSGAALKAAAGDGDGRTGTAALNDGDAAAQARPRNGQYQGLKLPRSSRVAAVCHNGAREIVALASVPQPVCAGCAGRGTSRPRHPLRLPVIARDSTLLCSFRGGAGG